ncbi:MAG: HU family DNA-binding protein [Rhodospirillaceae bacterium]
MTLSNATPRHSSLAPSGSPRAANRGSVTTTQAAQPVPPSETEANHETAALTPDPGEETVETPCGVPAADAPNSEAAPQTVRPPLPKPTGERKRPGRPRGSTKTLARAELIYEFRRNLGLPAKEAERALGALEVAIRTALERGETVRLIGVGSFTPMRLKERILRNPYTGENFTASPTKVRFKAAADLRAAIAISL